MDKAKTEQNAPEQVNLEYTTAEIVDYGDLQELTASHTNTGITDVPKGTQGPHVFSTP